MLFLFSIFILNFFSQSFCVYVHQDDNLVSTNAFGLPADLPYLKKQSPPPGCLICETIMTVIIETLSTNTTVNDIIRELDHECQRVPVSLRNACIGFGKALVNEKKY